MMHSSKGRLFVDMNAFTAHDAYDSVHDTRGLVS